MTALEAAVQQYEKTILEIQGRLAQAASEILMLQQQNELLNKNLAEANKKLEPKPETEEQTQ